MRFMFQPRSLTLTLALLSAICAAATAGAGAPASAAGGDERYCPKGGSDPIEVTRLVDKRVRTARRMARRHGCLLRVVKRDGEWLVVTDDFRTDRVNVIVRKRILKRVQGIG